ncbi:galactosyltransferase-related protein [Aeromicrobium fastidiosum]|uniref:glycosyltransferase family 2 protein n=1 Tax=Aeromicrobium TaxID=2040 RepID=UPI0017851B1A|nr:galactosyltransferase-related protein [Aeromicrobium fastidiosum]MBD8607309.1 glycosyltransferase family 2 protein [Aeromicrobium sp. CFBP 8757]MCL8252158.1 galactosyltransferase-related protein [Aeromicrobium fastidiosum]
MNVVAVTIVHGRSRHLARQHEGLLRSTRPPDLHVVVAMDDPSVAAVDEGPFERVVVPVEGRAEGLPLAHARNVGARAAVDAGADVLVFLDVDCIPAPELVAAYASAAGHPTTCDDLLCGPVAYLPPLPDGQDDYDLDTLDRLAEPHAARPAPAPGAIERDARGHDLFWSLSFALRARAWDAIGGFDERYVGYGGEDTDFARRAAAAGRGVAWVGAARAFHQHHPVSSPPVEHVSDIVRNAGIFHDTWGRWPMGGWLDAFERSGLVGRLDDGTYVVTERGPRQPEAVR